MDVRAEVEKALDIAAKVAENPLAQSALGLAFVPPSVTGKVGELLQVLDAELAKAAPAVSSDPLGSSAGMTAAAAGSIFAAPADAIAPAEPAASDPKAEATVPAGGPGPSTGPSIPDWVKPLPSA